MKAALPRSQIVVIKENSRGYSVWISSLLSREMIRNDKKEITNLCSQRMRVSASVQLYHKVWLSGNDRQELLLTLKKINQKKTLLIIIRKRIKIKERIKRLYSLDPRKERKLDIDPIINSNFLIYIFYSFIAISSFK